MSTGVSWGEFMYKHRFWLAGMLLFPMIISACERGSGHAELSTANGADLPDAKSVHASNPPSGGSSNGQAATPSNAGAGKPSDAEAAKAKPHTLLLDADTLAQVREKAQAGQAGEYKAALDRLRGEADQALKTGPFSVMYKTGTPPSGDKHDYMSMAPYWWPDPSKPDGKPYLNRDGKTNPEGSTDKYDKSNFGRMTSAVNTLSLAYYFTGHEPYAEHAAKLIRTWFLDADTRMNPNMNFAQSVPGVADGRKEGVLESQSLLDLVDDVELLKGANSWSDQDAQRFRDWILQYLKWLKENKLAQDERKAANNHGTWYDAIFAGLTAATGDSSGAAAYIRDNTTKRIASQIAPDGSMPQEIKRTRSYHYPIYNLRAFSIVAILGDKVGFDLWNYQTADGRSLRKAFDFIVPYVNGKPWPYAQIQEEKETEFARFLRVAAIKYHEKTYAEAAQKLLGSEAATHRFNLTAPKPNF